MRILITGTTGWLGAALASNLAAKDSHEVVGLARRTTLLDGVASLQADLSSKQDMEALSKQPPFDVVVHLAGAAGWCSLEQAVDINVAGTQNLLAATRKAGARKFVIASSVAVTGSCSPRFPPCKLPISNEDGFVGSQWAYGWSKAMVEQLVHFIGGSPEGRDADYMLVRIGYVVTNPPAPLLHLETAIDEKIPIAAADLTDAPKEATFPEGPLCAIALKDLTRCLELATEAAPKPGVRTVTAVGPNAFSRRPVPDVMRSWYGEAAAKIDMAHHSRDGHEFDPIYDTESAKRELGFVAEVDLRATCL